MDGGRGGQIAASPSWQSLNSQMKRAFPSDSSHTRARVHAGVERE